MLNTLRDRGSMTRWVLVMCTTDPLERSKRSIVPTSSAASSPRSATLRGSAGARASLRGAAGGATTGGRDSRAGGPAGSRRASRGGSRSPQAASRAASARMGARGFMATIDPRGARAFLGWFRRRPMGTMHVFDGRTGNREGHQGRSLQLHLPEPARRRARGAHRRHRQRPVRHRPAGRDRRGPGARASHRRSSWTQPKPRCRRWP